MPLPIKIRDFNSVVQYADLEDLPVGTATEMKNLRIINGKIVKTSEHGAFLDQALNITVWAPSRLFTWVNPNLGAGSTPVGSGTGFLYCVATVNKSTKKLQVYTWNGTSGAWVKIDAGAAGIDLTTVAYYQTLGDTDQEAQNPVILANEIRRLLPGNTALPDGTNVAVGLWIGWIDRDYFDGLLLAAAYGAKFFSYATEVAKPDIDNDFASFSAGQLQGGRFTELAANSGYEISEVLRFGGGDPTSQYFNISGDVTEELGTGSKILVADSTANDGIYVLLEATFNEGENLTRLGVDFNYLAIADTTADGNIIAFAPLADRKFYKLSYVYDGNQESLVSDEVMINYNFARDMYGQFEFVITNATWNKRITAMKVYRSDNAEGPYSLIQTIDFLRPTTNLLTGTAAFGSNAVYIPELDDFDFNVAYTYELYLRKTGSSFIGTEVLELGRDALSGTGIDAFETESQISTWVVSDFWDVDWYLKENDGGGFDTVRSGTKGAYSGERAMILTSTEDTGENNSAGSMFYLSVLGGLFDQVTSATTVDSGDRTKFKTFTSHFLKVGAVVQLSGFVNALNLQYNGYFVVMIIDSATEFTVDAKFGINEVGADPLWSPSDENWRIVEENIGKAIKTSVRFPGRSGYPSYRFIQRQYGLFMAVSSGGGSTTSYSFFDNDLTDGAKPPLEGAVSVNVNGRFARMIAARLHQANIVLDPSGKAEEQPEWGSFSELDQPDVTPVSNVIRFQDDEGGPLTGLEELFGLAVYTKRFSIITINSKSSPADPSLWTRTESIHNIGNLAPLGMVKAKDAVYPCAIDGIYAINPNNLSDTDQTPTSKLKTTEAIENIYNSMTFAQKQAIVAVYHQRRNEIHYYMTYPVDEVDTLKRWAYNVVTGGWREIFADYQVLLTGKDEESNAIALQELTAGIAAGVIAVEPNRDDDDDPDGSRFLFRSKVFPIDDVAPEAIRNIVIIYKSPHELVLRIYLDGNDTLVEEYTLPAQADQKPYNVAIGYSALRMQFVITDDIGVALVAEVTSAGPVYLIVEQNELSPNVEISGFDIF